MNEELTLVVLAAGMGSRYGGLKQMDPVGPNGEFIIDYSIYDAIEAGFTKVVFIIKKAIEEEFKATIGERIKDKIKIEYAFQELDKLPEGFKLPEGREKPWGTGHAVLCAKDNVHGNFVMINSDDFYGRMAYKVAADFFRDKSDTKSYAMVGFNVVNTMTENGSVKRGVCEAENNNLTQIIESSIEHTEDDKFVASPLDGREPFEVKAESLVSMNFFCFRESFMNVLEKDFPNFLNNNTDPLKGEYLVPSIVDEQIHNGTKCRVLESTDRWLGVTYKEDKDFVVREINKLIEEGKYPSNLWS